MVIAPSSTCATNSFTRSLPRSRCAASPPSRPRSTILSSSDVSVVAAAAVAAESCGSGIRITVRLQTQSEFVLQTVVLLLVSDGFQQQLVPLVVSLPISFQIRQPRSQFEQFANRFHLARDLFG